MTSEEVKEVKVPSNPSNLNGVPTTTLEADTMYRFDAWGIGSFLLKGGNSGDFVVEHNHHHGDILITDLSGETVFSCEKKLGDFVHFQDQAANGTTLISFAKYGKTLAWETFPVRAYPQCPIYLEGLRNFEIKGSGADLKHTGKGEVTVIGDVRKLETEDGSGDVYIHGSVGKGVLQLDDSRVWIYGNVNGKIVMERAGSMEVFGDVLGDIEQKGFGEIHVYGKHSGVVSKTGVGIVKIDQ